MLDFDSLKIVEIERGASGSGEYSAGRFEATLEIDDEDFFKVATKEVTFKELIEQVEYDFFFLMSSAITTYSTCLHFFLDQTKFSLSI